MHERSSIRVGIVHLPAMNTPQFGWGKVLMDRRPQPIPPILQPEVAGEAVAWMATHPRKELWVDRSTVRLALADRLAPRLLDGIVARRGWDGQLSDEPVTNAADNLWDPVDVDAGAHGRFDAVAQDRRLQVHASMHRRAIAAGLSVVALALGARLGRARWRSRS